MRWMFGMAAVVVASWSSAATTTGSPGPLPARAPDLVAAIERYRAIESAGGWPMVPPTETVHPGDRSRVVGSLRARLAVTGDLTESDGGPAWPPPPPDLYAGDVVNAVRGFQARHGLTVDGVVGRRTLAALNVPATKRLRQLELAAERARRRRPPLAHRYVRVNIAAYWLELVENGRSVLEMPVVVGRPDRATPEMTSEINFIVFNPPWTIPSKLAYEDVLPKARRDPEYFAKQGITIYDGWRANAEEIDPEWIDWRLVGTAMKGLKLRQAPGQGNPLGRIKFHMANAFDVYLHDTSSHGLLARADRALSSGCIRVGDARALATAALTGDAGWNATRVDEVIASGETTKIHLRERIPVQIYYQTAWATADGGVQFRSDIYDADDAFAAELAATPDPVPDTLGRATPLVAPGPAPGD